jgi:diacylglycerol kinase family enzyme
VERGIPILINASAGRGGERRTWRVIRTLHEAGVPGDVRVIAPELVPAAAARAVADGVPVLAVAGGDGTMRGAAEVLSGTATALAPLPTGTFNTFARRLGIETLETGARRVGSPERMRVPVGVVNQRLFLNTVTFGQYARVVRRRDRLQRRLARWPAAALAFLRAVVRPRLIDLEIDTPNAQLRRQTPLLWIRTAWQEEPSATRLEVVIFRLQGMRQTAAFMLRRGAGMMRGNIPEDDARVEVIHTRTLVVRGARSIDLTLDGEPFRAQTPVLVATLEHALNVVGGP